MAKRTIDQLGPLVGEPVRKLLSSEESARVVDAMYLDYIRRKALGISDLLLIILWYSHSGSTLHQWLDLRRVCKAWVGLLGRTRVFTLRQERPESIDIPYLDRTQTCRFAVVKAELLAKTKAVRRLLDSYHPLSPTLQWDCCGIVRVRSVGCWKITSCKGTYMDPNARRSPHPLRGSLRRLFVCPSYPHCATTLYDINGYYS